MNVFGGFWFVRTCMYTLCASERERERERETEAEASGHMILDVLYVYC